MRAEDHPDDGTPAYAAVVRACWPAARRFDSFGGRWELFARGGDPVLVDLFTGEERVCASWDSVPRTVKAAQAAAADYTARVSGAAYLRAILGDDHDSETEGRRG